MTNDEKEPRPDFDEITRDIEERNRARRRFLMNEARFLRRIANRLTRYANTQIPPEWDKGANDE